MSNERIEQLERAVKRWKLVSLCLALLLVMLLAVGGTLTAIPATDERGDFWLWLPWVRAARERAAREDVLRAVRRTVHDAVDPATSHAGSCHAGELEAVRLRAAEAEDADQ
jgi:hypothetical protein